MRTILTCLLLFTIFMVQTFASGIPDDEMLTILMKRIERLELSDSKNKREIAKLVTKLAETETKCQTQETEIARLSTRLVQVETDYRNEESELHKKLAGLTSKTPGEGALRLVDYLNKEVKQQLGDSSASRDEERRSSVVRQAVETEVAFYATHSQHDIQHLGQNQIIPFDKAVLNLGNSFNPNHGAFVAPVDGTYVFHVTMMGKDAHNVSNNHFSTHIDVNGVSYSEMWVKPYSQSSQMFVIDLKAGKTVSVRNRFLDDGFIGQHMSTFSGFLLYQHFDSSAIVGK